MALSKIGTNSISDSAVATAKIADDAIATAKIADDAIATAKIADSAVATAKIADDAVGNTKLDLGANYTFTGTISGAGEDNDAVLITSASGGGATTQVFNGCFSSTYEHYMILASIQLSATGQINLRLQNSSNAEIASNYFYSGRNAFQANGSQGGSAIGVWSANQISPEFNALGNPHAFYKIFVFKPYQSAKTVIDLRYHCQQNYSEQFNSSSVTGTLDETTSCTGFRFVTTNGNINSSSSFRIYGFK